MFPTQAFLVLIIRNMACSSEKYFQNSYVKLFTYVINLQGNKFWKILVAHQVWKHLTKFEYILLVHTA